MAKKNRSRSDRKKYHVHKIIPFTLLASAVLTGAILVNNHGATPATPAVPFPGLKTPAIPAQPAQPPIPQKPNTNKEFIFIMSPYGGKGWVRGPANRTSGPYKGMNIVWVWISQKPGEIQFEINLLKGGSFYRKIASYQAQSDAWLGQTWWEIPQDIPEGSDYTIEVREERGHKFRVVNAKPFAILGENITVSGKLIDLFSKKPLSSVEYRSIEGNRMETDSEGRFAFSGNTDPPPKANTGIWYNPSCYMTEGLSGYYNVSYGEVVWGSPPEFPQFQLYMYNSNSYDLLRSSSIEPDLKMYPVLTTNLDLGDILVRPSGNLVLTSDIPVTIQMDYADKENRIEGGGSGVFNDKQTLANLFPIDYDTRVVLTDKAGTQYISPYHKVEIEKQCENVPLNFSGAQFTW